MQQAYSTRGKNILGFIDGQHDPAGTATATVVTDAKELLDSTRAAPSVNPPPEAIAWTGAQVKDDMGELKSSIVRILHHQLPRWLRTNTRYRHRIVLCLCEWND
jgi:hypothetical protein